MTGYTYYFPIGVHPITEENVSEIDSGTPGHPIIILVTDGWSRIQLNRTVHKLTRYSVLCCNRQSSPRWLEARSFRGIAIEYTNMTLDSGPPERLPLPDLPLSGSQELLSLAQQMEAAWLERASVPLEPQRLLLELLTRLQAEPLPTNQTWTAPWLKRVMDLLHRRSKEEWTRETLADYAGVSPEHFSRVFRKETGSTFTSYLNLLRIREAQLRLLKGQAGNLNELARQVGYKDGYYFSKKFKSVIGHSPAIYLQKPRRIISSNYNHTEMLHELGVKPVIGAYSSWSRHRQAAEEQDQWELHWEKGIGSYEQLEQAKPDIIIGYKLLADDKRLYRYAAVEAIPLFALSWREQFRIIADIAGQRQKAEETLARYDGLAEESNERLNQHGIVRGTAAVWEVYSDITYVFDASFGRGAQVLYDDLGFQKPSELQQQGIEKRGYLSKPISAIAETDCDYLFIVAMKDSPSIRHLFQSHAWKSLSAVINGRVYFIDDFDRFYGYDPHSTELQLQCLMECLIS